MKGVSRIALAVALFLSLLCALGLALTRSHDRSDAALRSDLAAHRADFEKLVSMSQEDVHLVKITQTFTWLDDNVAWPRKDVGISEQRWNEYRRLFHKVSAVNGLVKDPNPLRVLFPIVSEGLAPTGWTKGLVYSPTPLSPVVTSLDEKPPNRLWEGSHVLAYAVIEEHWYIYYEQW